MASLLETDPLSAIILLLVGVVSIILALLLLKEYIVSKKPYHLAWAISFLVLFVSGVLIIFLGWEETLENPLVPPIAALIPVGLAIGLIFAVWPNTKYGLYYALYAIIVIGILAIVRVVGGDLSGFSSPLIMGIHIPSGLIISFLPLYTSFISKYTDWTGVFFGIGGLLISFGGVLLAFATVPGITAILPLTDILVILPILLLIVGVFFLLGIGLPKKWSVPIPFLNT
ncbi:MAG: hypothetical protein ACFFAU_07290 [Candidatus Hodarchaeota archaeon]